ncbi:MAG: hypothetical protein ACLFP2_02995 [Candidatus Woesearchaeota archaeon]
MGLEDLVRKNPYAGARDVVELIDIAIRLNGYQDRMAYLRTTEKEGINLMVAKGWFGQRTIPLEKILYFADDLSIPHTELEHFGYDINRPYSNATNLGELIDVGIHLKGYTSRWKYLEELAHGFHPATVHRWIEEGRIPIETLALFSSELSLPSSELQRFGYDPDNPYSKASNLHDLFDTAIRLNGYKHRLDYFLQKGQEHGFSLSGANYWLKTGSIPIKQLQFFVKDLSIPPEELLRFGYDVVAPYSDAKNVVELLNVAIGLHGYASRNDYLKEKSQEGGFKFNTAKGWFARGKIPLDKLLSFANDLSIPSEELARFGYDLENPFSNASDIAELIDLAIRLQGYSTRNGYMQDKSLNPKSAYEWFSKKRIPPEKLSFFAEDLCIPTSELERFGYKVSSFAGAGTIKELIDIGIKQQGYTSRNTYLAEKAKEKGLSLSAVKGWFGKRAIPLDKLVFFAKDLSIPVTEFERLGYELRNPYANAEGVAELLELAIRLNGYKHRDHYLKMKAPEKGFHPATAKDWFASGNFSLEKLLLFADDLSIPYEEFERFGINLSNPYAEAETMVQALRTAISLQGETVVGYLRSREGERPFSVYMGQAFFSKNSFSEKGLEFLINDLDLPDNVFGEADWSAYDGIMGYKDYLAEENLNVKAYFETFEGQSPYQYVIQFYKTEPVKNEITFEDFLYSQVPDEHKEEAWYVLSGRYKEDLMMDKLSELAEDTELKSNIEELLGE